MSLMKCFGVVVTLVYLQSKRSSSSSTSSYRNYCADSVNLLLSYRDASYSHINIFCFRVWEHYGVPFFIRKAFNCLRLHLLRILP